MWLALDTTTYYKAWWTLSPSRQIHTPTNQIGKYQVSVSKCFTRSRINIMSIYSPYLIHVVSNISHVNFGVEDD